MTSVTNDFQFKRVWFITGASRGFGALIAKAAIADGNAVVATGRNIDAIVERVGASPALLPLKLDVTDQASAHAAARAAVEHFGRIDVLVNNAGFGLLGAVEESSDAEVRRLFDTNVFGLLNVTRAVLPIMRAQRSGMSSIFRRWRAIAPWPRSVCTVRPNSRSKALPKRCATNSRRSAFTPQWWNRATSGRIFWTQVR